MVKQDLQEVLSFHIANSGEGPAGANAALVLNSRHPPDIAPVEGGGGVGHGVSLGVRPVVAAMCPRDCLLHARTIHTPS